MPGVANEQQTKNTYFFPDTTANLLDVTLRNGHVITYGFSAQ